jgi:hypothetical protein
MRAAGQQHRRGNGLVQRPGLGRQRGGDAVGVGQQPVARRDDGLGPFVAIGRPAVPIQQDQAQPQRVDRRQGAGGARVDAGQAMVQHAGLGQMRHQHLQPVHLLGSEIALMQGPADADGRPAGRAAPRHGHRRQPAADRPDQLLVEIRPLIVRDRHQGRLGAGGAGREPAHLLGPEIAVQDPVAAVAMPLHIHARAGGELDAVRGVGGEHGMRAADQVAHRVQAVRPFLGFHRGVVDPLHGPQDRLRARGHSDAPSLQTAATERRTEAQRAVTCASPQSRSWHAGIPVLQNILRTGKYADSRACPGPRI